MLVRSVGLSLALALTAGWALAQTSQTSAAAPAAASTDAAIEQLRKDSRAEKADIIASTMEFNADEAAKFWPLYKEYETAQKAVGDEKVSLIKDYAANYQSMTDQKAGELLGRLIAVEDKSTAAKRQFIQQLQKVLPAKKVAAYYQVENRIKMLVDLNLASQIPIVK